MIELGLVFVLLIADASTKCIDFCNTPAGNPGQCVPLNECSAIAQALSRVVPIEKVIVLRNKLRCTPLTGNATLFHVCCPKPEVPNEDVGEPPDVTCHENLKLLPKKCGMSSTTPKLFDGNKTALFEYPWMALLQYNYKTQPYRCAGTVLNDKYILTAAHCVIEPGFPVVKVRVGEHNITSTKDCEIEEDGNEICADPVQDLEVEEIIPHAGYNISEISIHDVALIRVKGTIDLSKNNVEPVCLPVDERSRRYNYTRRHGFVTGWGRTELLDYSPVLLKIGVPFVPIDKCTEVFNSLDTPINKRQLCAGGGAKADACWRDSGGPIQIIHRLKGFGSEARNVQHGIVSFGTYKCAQKGYPGVYTNVAHYMDWILDHIKP